MKALMYAAWGLYFGLLTLATLIIVIASSWLPSPYTSYIIRSGSMEPTIMTGDLIIDNTNWKPAKNLVVTFKDNKDRLVTHRIIDEIVENSKTFYQAKGDNNEDPDPELIPAEQVVGVWYASFSHLGYVAVWLKRPVVFLIVIFLPFAILMTLDALLDKKNKLPYNKKTV